jgi:hypothetical protein
MGDDILVIEDIRTFYFPAIYARDIETARELLYSKPWSMVWFDHDMGLSDGCETTIGLAREMEERAVNGEILPIGRIIIHTANPVGRINLLAALNRHYDVTVVDANVYLAKGEVPMYWVGKR